jgi:hypothetical protein
MFCDSVPIPARGTRGGLPPPHPLSGQAGPQRLQHKNKLGKSMFMIMVMAKVICICPILAVAYCYILTELFKYLLYYSDF